MAELIIQNFFLFKLIKKEVTSYNMSENEMGNRGSKSNFSSYLKFVNEQRIDGS